jgi:plasmid stability protein
MKTTLDLPDDLVKQIKLRAVNDGMKLKDAMADLLRKGLSTTSPKSMTRVKADKTTVNQRAEMTRKFISGEWGVELSGFEAANTVDRRTSTKRAKAWRE